LPNQ